MNEDYILDLSYQVIKVTAMVGAPLLLGSLLIGILISFFQAVTQINEQTLTFIPKMIVMTLSLILFGPWIIDVLTEFTTSIFLRIPELANY